METLETSIRPDSPEFRANRSRMAALVDELRTRLQIGRAFECTAERAAQDPPSLHLLAAPRTALEVMQDGMIRLDLKLPNQKRVRQLAHVTAFHGPSRLRSLTHPPRGPGRQLGPEHGAATVQP